MRGSSFHDSWYKVAKLKPRIHVSLKVYRQEIRGQTWYVMRDPSNNQFFRLNRAAYQFLALLDGKRTVDQAWTICFEEHGDDSPTQGESITMLGQLYSANLLQGDVPADTQGLLKRHDQRLRKQAQAGIKGILFARIPLWDPDSFLEKWVFLFGPFFSRLAYVFGFALLALAGYFLLNNFEALGQEGMDNLSLSQLPYLYLIFIGTKIVHEFGHGFACKYYGQKADQGGDVHTMGIALLLLTPVPYVDASSSWALASKWQRMAIAAAGMYIELLVAAVAAIVWANTSEGQVMHTLSLNTMIVAGVTSLFFNGNPLLRYDAYYMLSDILEIPNLAGRSQMHFKYLWRRYIFGVKHAQSPAYDRKEAIHFFVYSISAAIYRFVLSISIVMIVAEFSPILGIIAAIGAAITLVIKPLIAMAKYVLNNPELSRSRGRAILISGSLTATALYFFAFWQTADHAISEAVIEPKKLQKIYVQADGFVRTAHKKPLKLKQGDTILKSENELLELEIVKLASKKRELSIMQRSFIEEEPAKAQIYASQILTLDEKLKVLEIEKEKLLLQAEMDGIFIPMQDEIFLGRFMRRGDELGLIYSEDEIHIRSIIDQDMSRVLQGRDEKVELKLRGRPDIELTGKVIKVMQAGSDQLASTALSFAGGGEQEVSQEDGKTTKEFFFEIFIEIDPQDKIKLHPGQVLMVRYRMPDRSLLIQSYQYLRRLFLKKFRI